MREAGGQWIVAPNHESLRAESLHQMTQHRATVRDDVEVKLIRVSRRRPRNRLLTFRHQPIAHVETPEDDRKRAARVIEDDAQRRMALEHSAINQKRGGQTGVVEIARE